MVARAVETISKVLDARGITINNEALTNQVEEWYWNSDISDLNTLCGCVIEYGHYSPSYSRQDMMEAAIVFKGEHELLL